MTASQKNPGSAAVMPMSGACPVTCEHRSVDPDDDYWEPPVEGSELRIMWDETAGPLWGDEGLLPEEPEWLSRVLALSDGLVTDLLQWLEDMTTLHFGSVEARRGLSRGGLNQQGESLAQRVQAEVGTRYRVRYHG